MKKNFFSKNQNQTQKRDVPLEFSKEETDVLPHWVTSGPVGPCRATQDGRLMVESSDKTWSTGERNGKPLQYTFLENPMNSMKGKKIGH